MARKRIALSMKLGPAPASSMGGGASGRRGAAQPGENRFQGAGNHQRTRTADHNTSPQNTAMASAFAKLKPG